MLTLLRAIDRFVRLHFLGFTALLLLLGAVSVEASPAPGALAMLLAIGLCFHNFAYVFNDVIDLPVDRTHPDRQDDYLVRGDVTPAQALAFSLAQIPLALLLAWSMGAGVAALAVLLAGFALMTIYDVWGKRCPIPPLTDLAQGLAWGSLSIFAALALGHAPTLTTIVAALHGVLFIFLINGVHGGLRDLDNDLARERITTASYFGAKPGQPLPPALRRFAMRIQIAMVLANLAPLVLGSFGFSPLRHAIVAVLVVAVSLACLVYMARVFHVTDPRWQRDFRVHLALLQVPPMLLFGAAMPPALVALMFGTMAWSFLFLDVTWQLARELVAKVLRG